MLVIDKSVSGKQLDRCHAEPLEVIGDSRCAKPPERASPGRWDILALLCEPFDVSFVDDRVFPGDPWPVVIDPGESVVHHHCLRHSTCIIAPIKRKITSGTAGPIPKMRIDPDESTGKSLGVRIDQQLVRIEAQAALGLVCAM